MSGPEPITPRCEMCGEPSVGEYPEGYPLCAHHLKDAKWKDALTDELKHVIGTWAKGHKLTQGETAELYAELDPHIETLADADTPVPRPERIDHFIEVEVQHPALVLSYFHLLREQAALAGFEDVWVNDIHLKIEVSGDERRLDELRKRIDDTWLGAWLSSSERFPRR